MGFDLAGLLQQYAGSNPANHNNPTNPTQAENDFDQVAQNTPPSLASIAGGALGKLFGGQGNANAAVPQLTPQQMATMTPEQVQEIASNAEQDNPGIVERMGAFCAEHPQLVKGLGGKVPADLKD